MNKGLRGVLSVVLLLLGVLRGLARPTVAAPVVPVENGVYTEDFRRIRRDDTKNRLGYLGWHLRLEQLDAIGQYGSLWRWTGAAMPSWCGRTPVITTTSTRNGWTRPATGSWSKRRPVNSDGGTAGQGFAVAVDGDGNAVVVAGQPQRQLRHLRAKTGRSRQPAVGAMRGSTATAGRQARVPAVAVDGSGNAVVVWQDNRNGDEDIYAQRLDAAGNRLWTQDARQF